MEGRDGRMAGWLCSVLLIVLGKMVESRLHTVYIFYLNLHKVWGGSTADHNRHGFS